MKFDRLRHKLTARSIVNIWSCVKPNLPQQKCRPFILKSVLYQITIILNISALTWYC